MTHAVIPRNENREMRQVTIKRRAFKRNSISQIFVSDKMSHSSHTHPFGKSINVLKFGEGNKVIIDGPELDKMFLHPDVKNRKVVVFSIIGAFRRGKSFFLDYCLRFLYANVRNYVDILLYIVNFQY